MYHQLLTNLQHLPLKLILSNTVKNYLKQVDCAKTRNLFSTLNFLNNGPFQAKINKQIIKKINNEYSAVCALIKRSHPQYEYVNNFSSSSIRQFHSSSVNNATPSSDPPRNSNKKPNKEDDDDENKVSSLLAKGFLWMLTAYMVIAIISLLFPNSNQPEVIRYVSWNEFVHHMLVKGEVQEIIVRPDVEIVTIILHEGAVIKGKRMEHRTFHMNVADVQRFEEKLREAERRIGVKEGVPINYERGGDTAGKLLLSLVIVALLMSLLSRSRTIGGPLRMDTFTQLGRAKFTLVDPLTGPGKGVHFADVAGLREAKQEVMEFVDYLKRPEHYKNLGAKVPKGALLLGPPGCGKTMLAKAVATESNVPFLSMNGSEFIEMIGGLGAARVRDLFKEAKKRSPCIIYIDEIDAVGRKRSQLSSGGGGGGGGGGMSGESEQTLNQLLVEMDGMATKEGIIMLASTNRADILDKALLRPGRFDRHILIDLPDLEEREQIFVQHLKVISLELTPEYYSKRLAYLTPGFSGADIANVCNEAALHAARCKQQMVTGNNLEYAVERLVGGTEKRNHAMSPEEKRIIAYHESGHALVGWMLQHTDALLKVTIVPRTNLALGFAQYIPTDQKLYSQDQLFERMCMILGGRVAESLTFNRITTGAQNDLEKATKMAYAQIREYGMNNQIGLISFSEQDLKELGRRPFSKRLATNMDEEARKLLFKVYKRTENVLTKHKDKLQLLAEALIQRETLNYNDVEAILGPPPFGKKRLIEPADFEAGLKKEVSKNDNKSNDVPSSSDSATKT